MDVVMAVVGIALVVALVAGVWLRQRRHPVAPGRHHGPDATLHSRGSFLGADGEGGGGR
ncbi:MAG: hypothetical protein ACRDO4_16815 [Nocardioides sp.]